MQRIFRFVSFALFSSLLIVLFSGRTSHAQTLPATQVPSSIAQTPKTITITNLNLSGPGSFADALDTAPAGSTIVFDRSLAGELRPQAGFGILRDLNIVGPSSRAVVFVGSSFVIPNSITANIRDLVFTLSTISLDQSTVNITHCIFRDTKYGISKKPFEN